MDIKKKTEWQKIIGFDIKSQWNENFEIVCGRRLHDTRIHEESHIKCDENGQRKHNFKIKKQKTNTKRSTEAEIFVAGDIIPDILWIGYF